MMRSEFQAEASRMSLASYAKPIYEQGIEVYYQLYQLQPHDSLLEKAFEFAEKSKAIVLLDAVRKTNARAHVSPDLIKAEKSMNLKVNYFEKQAALKEQDSTMRLSYHVYDSLLYYRRQREMVLEEIKAQTPEYHQLMFNQETSKINEIQRQLSYGEAFVEYFLGDSSLYTFAITADKALFLKDEAPDEIKRLAQEWLSVIPAMNKDFLNPGNQLYKLLIEPLKGHIDLPEILTIVPDDVLNLLSFEALNKEPPGKESVYLPDFDSYLIYEHQVNYAYSASTLRETPVNDKKGRWKYLGIAPKLENGFYQQNIWFDKLEYNVEEVRHAADLFPKSTLIQSASAKAEFMRSAGDYSVIHCATHAIANNRNGDLSFISFGEDEADIIYAKDLYALDLDANLVVLSACQTSAGERNKGEGIISLARSFSYAGASSVVTSLWNVREKSNNEIIYEFYRLLRRGKTKDEALRMAKLKYISGISKANHASAHPYFWAPLVIIGDTAPLSNNRINEISVAVLAGLLVLTIFFLWKKRRRTAA
jgi:CHAT domain-containing protein